MKILEGEIEEKISGLISKTKQEKSQLKTKLT